MTMALILAYFVQHSASDRAFHVRGQPSPRDQRRMQRQRAVGDWAKQRKAGGTAKRPEGPWRGYLRDLNADTARSATVKRRAMRDNRHARKDRRKERRVEARQRREQEFRNPTPQPVADAPEPEPYPMVRDAEGNLRRRTHYVPDYPVLEFERNTGNNAPIDGDGRVLPDDWCHRHFPDGFCGRETDGGLYCDRCTAELNPDPPVDHEPPTEPAPEDDRPQPADGDTAPPEQPQTSAAEQEGIPTMTADVETAAEGGVEEHTSWDDAMIAHLDKVIAAIEHTIQDREDAQVKGSAVDGLENAKEDLENAKANVEIARGGLEPSEDIGDQYAASDYTAGSAEFVTNGAIR